MEKLYDIIKNYRDLSEVYVTESRVIEYARTLDLCFKNDLSIDEAIELIESFGKSVEEVC